VIQRIPKINIPAAIAMCATFAVSVLLVHFLRPTPAVTPLRSRPATSTVKSEWTPASIPQGMIRYQSNAPIKFVGAETGTCMMFTMGHPECFYLIAKNVSGRRITGYALTYGHKGSTGGGTTSSYVTSMNDPSSMDLDASFPWDIDSGDNDKEVWVDFVEFSDGTVWGPNITRALERMNAERVGTCQSALYYAWVLQTLGPDAMLDAMRATFKAPVANSQTDQYDEHWKDGFNSGVTAVRWRLLSDKSDVEALTKSQSGEAYNAALTDHFRRTLLSYSNFRR